MCEYQKPRCFGLCTSRAVSEYLWWSLCVAAHQSGPFCVADVPTKASKSWNTREVLYVRWAKYRW
jgi:hypothetical protein